MNSIAGRWDAVENRHRVSARVALSGLLERDDADHRERAQDIVRRAAGARPEIAATRRDIVVRRAALAETASRLTAIGMLSAGVLALLGSAFAPPLEVQALLLVAALFAMGLFGLVSSRGAPAMGVQLLIQLMVSMVLLAGLADYPFGLALAVLGWAAAFARAWVQARAHGLDLAEMELALEAVGRDAEVMAMQRKRAAAI